MVRVITPTTAVFILGAVYCNNKTAECSSKICDHLESDNGGNNDRPESPLSLNDASVQVTEFHSISDDDTFKEESISVASSSTRSRSSSNEYDGDCEQTPNHLYRTIIEELPKRLSSGFTHLLSDHLISLGEHEDELEKYSDYYNQEEADDSLHSSSHDSLVKTRGGSKGSNCNALRKASGHRTKPVNSHQKMTSFSADSHDVTDDCKSQTFANNVGSSSKSQTLEISAKSQTFAQPLESPAKSQTYRPESPFTRSSRVNSIEEEMTHVPPEDSIEHQIIHEIFPKIATGPYCAILDGIDRLASEELQRLSKQVGTFIFEHLWYQIIQVNPDKPVSANDSYQFFVSLSEIYAHVVNLYGDSAVRFDLGELVQECLKATLSYDFNEYKPVRDAIILLMLNYPNYFDDQFLETVEMYEIFKAIVDLSNENEHFDTVEYVRVVLSFPDMFDFQNYFEVTLKKPPRKPSDELFLPLMEGNLVDKTAATATVSTITSMKTAKPKSKKKDKKKDPIKPPPVVNNYLAMFNGLVWENRLVLSYALIIAVIIQCLFLQK